MEDKSEVTASDAVMGSPIPGSAPCSPCEEDAIRFEFLIEASSQICFRYQL